MGGLDVIEAVEKRQRHEKQVQVDDDDEQVLVDDKEQLLADGNAEEAWSLFLLEQQDKFWSIVRDEVASRIGPGD